MAADNEITQESARRVSWDLFYRGADGFGEHFQVTADDSAPIIKGRAQLLEWLKSIGAKPLPRDIDFPSKAPPVRAAADPMLAAAQQVLGAKVSRTCPIHNVEMKHVPAGFSTRTNKQYNAFWACEAVNGCRGGESR